MTSTEGWQKVIKPLLTSKISNSWLDPRKTSDEKDFFHQYTVAWATANAVDEILKMIESYEERVKSLRAKQQEDEPYRIGQ